MRVFRDLQFVENLGSGIHRILKQYNRSIFKISENFIELCFPFDEAYQLQLNSGLVDGLVERLVDGLVESQQKVVLLMAANPKVSKKALAETIGISTTAIDKNIAALKEKNIIRRVGSDRSGHWQLIARK